MLWSKSMLQMRRRKTSTGNIMMLSVHTILLSRLTSTFTPRYHSNSYGLKSWAQTPIDIIEDDGCSLMPTVEGLFSLRSPDTIKLVTVGEDMYIITANEVSMLEQFRLPHLFPSDYLISCPFII